MNANQSSHRQLSFVSALSLCLTVVAVFPQTSFAQAGSITFSLHPVTANGMHSHMGNKIILQNAGQRVWFDLYHSQWAPELLEARQLKIVASSYANHSGAPITVPIVPCATDMECEMALGMGSTCALEGQTPYVSGINVCRAGYFTTSRADDFSEESGGPFALAGVATNAKDFFYEGLAITDPPKTDLGVDIYAGTLVLNIPEHAAGTYTIDYSRDGFSFANNDDGQSMEIIYQPAIVELPGGCCLSDSCQDGILSSNCESMGGTPVPRCRYDCNDNGINDACDLATGSGFDNNNDGFIDDCDGSVTFSMKPVKASGSYNIQGNTIYLDQGDQDVWFELKFSEWGPKLVVGAQLMIDSGSFSNGVGGPLEPTEYACTTHEECESLLGPGAKCAGISGSVEPNVTGFNVCRTVFYTSGRDDDVPEENGGLYSINGINTSTLDFAVGAAIIVDPPKSDPGFEVYLTSFVMHVPDNASGTYVIQAKPYPDSHVYGSEADLDIIYHPIIIELSSGCCLPNGTCQNGLSASLCFAAGGTPNARPCGLDCNSNGTNDTCELNNNPSLDCDDNNQIDTCEISNNRSLDCNFNFKLDACDIANGTSMDCNGNQKPDQCDIAEDLMVKDCNSNGVLDSCEILAGGMMAQDCNNNNVIDDCELYNSGADCDGNGVLDECDLAEGTGTDNDGNCVLDVCDPSTAPLAEPNGLLKSRYISFIPTNTGCNSAIRVKLVSLYHPDPPAMVDFSAFEGEYRWVGSPTIYPEDQQISGYHFTGAQLQCEPYFMNWAPVNLVHAFGAAVVPDSIYEIQMVDDTCPDLNDPGCYTDLLEVRTGRWGDIIAPFAADMITQQPTISDVLALVNKLQGYLHPIKAEAQLQSNIPTPTFRVSPGDVNKVVDAWLGTPYPYAGPSSCDP